MESNGERNRLLFVIKNRGSAHSNQVREFVMTGEGPELVDVFVGPDGVLTGSGRRQQIDRDQRDARLRVDEASRLRRHLEARTAEVEAQVATLRRQLESEVAEATRRAESLDDQLTADAGDRATRGASRSTGDDPRG